MSGNEGEQGQKELRGGQVAHDEGITALDTVLGRGGTLDFGINRDGSCLIKEPPHRRGSHYEEHGKSQKEEGNVGDRPVTERPAVPREINEGEVGGEGNFYQ